MTDLDGKEFEISAWEGTTQAGDYKLSIQISTPYVKTGDKADKSEEKDNLPF